MSEAIEAVIPARRRVVAGHEIRRLLPSRQRRMVGPFIFFDHIGPEKLDPGQGIDIPPHPHIHLATVTYLFEGTLIHRDSVGSVETIRPGDINWMHAGRGIVHSERSDPESRERESALHGIQLWVALPQDQEETQPAFEHYPEASLPSWSDSGVDGRLLVGNAYGYASPVRTRSKTLYMDLVMAPGATFPLPGGCEEMCAYVASGIVSVGETKLKPGEITLFTPNTPSTLSASGPARVLILGGDPIDGERHIRWNFVSSSKDRIEQAKRDWNEGRFPAVPGDEESALARLSHELSATAPDPSASAAFRFVGLLDVPSSTPPVPSGRAPCSDGVSDSSRRKPLRKAG